MLFLGIISLKGVSCFNGGGGVFQMGGFIFKWGCPMGDISFGGGFSKKIVRWGNPHAPSTMGNPVLSNSSKYFNKKTDYNEIYMYLSLKYEVILNILTFQDM